jgi:Holliday junction resolvase RusA-like endonuclease
MLYGIVPFLPISVNKMYRELIVVRKGFRGKPYPLEPRVLIGKVIAQRVLTGEARAEKNRIINYISGSIKKGFPLKIEIELHGNWYNKNGTVKKKDLDEKLLIDSIFESLPEIDDSMIFEKNVRKVQSDKPKAVFAITELSGN